MFANHSKAYISQETRQKLPMDLDLEHPQAMDCRPLKNADTDKHKKTVAKSL